MLLRYRAIESRGNEVNWLKPHERNGFAELPSVGSCGSIGYTDTDVLIKNAEDFTQLKKKINYDKAR
jgi:hypothetical protein